MPRGESFINPRCACRRYLGIDTVKHGSLLWIAEAALCAPLPKGWAEYTDNKGNVYFHKASEGTSTWEHPLDNHFRDLYRTEQETGGTGLAQAAVGQTAVVTKHPLSLRTLPSFPL